jgi:phenylacetate-CoA ligase
MSAPMTLARTPIVWPSYVAPWPVAMPDLAAGLERSQRWDEGALCAGQQAQLMALLEWAAAKIPYYKESDWLAEALGQLRARQRDFWEIWRTLPILAKSELRSEGKRLNARDVPQSHLPLGRTITSGSTGISVEVATTAVTAAIWKALTLREHFWSRRDVAKRLGAIRYLPKADRDAKGYTQASWPSLIAALGETGPFSIIHVGLPIDTLADWLVRFDPHYLIAHPSVVTALLDELSAAGRGPASLKEVLFVAEPLPPALQARLAEQHGVRSAEYYSANEVGYIALRCAEAGRLHVQSEAVFVEILDSAGRPCAPGETGRVVVTSLHNLATPLIRYELGDYAVAGGRCSCGRTLPVIDRVLGRVRNLVRTPDGRRHWPVELGKFRAMPAIRQFQYVQSGPETIELRVVLNEPLSTEEQLQAQRMVREALGYPFKVAIKPVEEIARGPTGKYEEFLSLMAGD